MELKTESTEMITFDTLSKKRNYFTITFTMEGGSTISLRPDSPKTIDVCRELGIDPEILKKKFDLLNFSFLNNN